MLLNALSGPEHGLVRKMLNQEAAEIAPLADMERTYVMDVLKIIEGSDRPVRP